MEVVLSFLNRVDQVCTGLDIIILIWRLLLNVRRELDVRSPSKVGSHWVDESWKNSSRVDYDKLLNRRASTHGRRWDDDRGTYKSNPSEGMRGQGSPEDAR